MNLTSVIGMNISNAYSCLSVNFISLLSVSVVINHAVIGKCSTGTDHIICMRENCVVKLNVHRERISSIVAKYWSIDMHEDHYLCMVQILTLSSLKCSAHKHTIITCIYTHQ